MDQRRNTRITGGFWLAVEGQDGSPVHRQGDISLTGAYFPVDQRPGDVGSSVYVHVASTDWSCSVQLPAKVVRIALIDDLVRGVVPIGAAVEFQPDSESTREAIAELVAKVAELERESRPGGSQRKVLASQILGENSAEAVAKGEEPGVDRIVFDAAWAPEEGERLEVEILRPVTRRRLSLQAEVKSVTDDDAHPGCKHVDLSVTSGTIRTTSTGSLSADSACQTLLTDLITDEDLTPNESLVGSLCRSMCVPSVLSFLAMEGMSGVLHVTSVDGQKALVFLRDGDVVDAETLAGLSPRDILVELVSWQEGSFEFHAGDVGREDKIGCGTTGLLLELTAEADELAR